MKEKRDKQGSWSDEVDEEKVQKVEWNEMVEKVEQDEKVEKTQKVQNTEKSDGGKKGDQDVLDEDEGMMKTPQVAWDLRQNEVQDELTDATNMEILRKIV